MLVYMIIPEEEGINLMRYLTKAKQQNTLTNSINLILADYFRKVLTSEDLEAMRAARQKELTDIKKKNRAFREAVKPDWDLSKDTTVPDTIPSPQMTEAQLDIIRNDESKNTLDIFSFR